MMFCKTLITMLSAILMTCGTEASEEVTPFLRGYFSSKDHDDEENRQLRSTTKYSGNKRIRIKSFTINGDDDVGSYSEIEIQLNHATYFPKSRSDCPYFMSDLSYWTDYCYLRQGKTQMLPTSRRYQSVGKGDIYLDVIEHDVWSNDDYPVPLIPSDWYAETDEKYYVKISIGFKTTSW